MISETGNGEITIDMDSGEITNDKEEQLEQPTTERQLTEIKLRKITTDGVLVSIGIAIPLISWFYIPFGGQAHWFARSGAVMAIVGIMLESRLFISKLMIYELANLKGGAVAPSGYKFAMSKLMAMLSHSILISGAIISGYGDLIFAAVKFGDTF